MYIWSWCTCLPKYNGNCILWLRVWKQLNGAGIYIYEKLPAIPVVCDNNINLQLTFRCQVCPCTLLLTIFFPVLIEPSTCWLCTLAFDLQDLFVNKVFEFPIKCCTLAFLALYIENSMCPVFSQHPSFKLTLTLQENKKQPFWNSVVLKWKQL